MSRKLYDELKKLGFSKDTYSEIILTLRFGDATLVAPMGVLLNDDSLKIRVFEGSRVYRAVLSGCDACILNVTRNPIYFFYAIFSKEKIKYVDGKVLNVKRVDGCDAYIECLIVDKKLCADHVVVRLKPLLIDIVNYYPSTHNRAGPAIIEALVHYTKIHVYKAAGLSNDDIYGKFIFLREIVYRSSKREDLRAIIDQIVGEAQRIIYGTSV